jgi:putative spermidine/putrescine transport system ATP-binding protein
MTVASNISFGLRMRGLPKDQVRERTRQAVELVALEDHVDKLPGQLSGGQQQRVAIARAVVLEPALVLMDEPLSNLDAKLRLGMRTEIRRLHQTLGLTTVYVTHDQEEALSLADRLVVLREGRVQQIGTPEELHTHPVTWHVADFMGYRNLLRVKASEGRAGSTVRLRGPGLDLPGTAVQDIREGDDVVAAVRPEDVEVLGEGKHEGSLGADVEVVEYQGREFAIEAQADDGLRLHLRSERRLAPGDRVSLHIPPERLLAFPADDVTGNRDGASTEPDRREAAGVVG